MTLPEQGNQNGEGWTEEGLPEDQGGVWVYHQIRPCPQNPDYEEERKVIKKGETIVVVGPMAFRKKPPPASPKS